MGALNINIAFAALVFTGGSALVAISFFLGKLANRVGDHAERLARLEKSDSDEGLRASGLRESFAEFRGEIKAELSHLSENLKTARADWISAVSYARPAAEPPPYEPLQPARAARRAQSPGAAE